MIHWKTRDIKEIPFVPHLNSMLIDSTMRRNWYGAISFTPIGEVMTRMSLQRSVIRPLFR